MIQIEQYKFTLCDSNSFLNAIIQVKQFKFKSKLFKFSFWRHIFQPKIAPLLNMKGG